MIPGPVTSQDWQLIRLRGQYPARRIHHVPWGWNSYTPGREDDISAPTLDELEQRLAQLDEGA